MNFKSMLLIIAAMLLIVSPVMAKGLEKADPSKTLGNASLTRDAESFEGAFPPAGWTIDTPSGHTGDLTWYQYDQSSFSGDFCAAVSYDPDLVAQDCRFSFDADISAGMDHLGFLAAASEYWMVQQGTYDMNVLINGTEVMNMAADYTVENWVYVEYIIDLTAHIGETVTVTFQYEGLDGAATYLDNVIINDGSTQVVVIPPPANDTCEGAIDLQVQGEQGFDVDLATGYTNASNLDSGSCTGYSAPGPDAFYSIDLAAGTELVVLQEGDCDMSIYLVTDCADPFATCVAGADGGSPEILMYTVDTAGTYYLIVDTYASAGCPVTVTLDGVVATEGASFGGLKAMYR